MAKRQGRRQRIRKALLLISFLLLPVTLYYFSPALILGGASEGVINGSFIVFGLMFISALFLGRAWCGWVCPAGALQDYCAPINNNRAPGGKFDWIKWGIWIPWIALIVILAASAGGYSRLDPFYGLEGGVTLAIPPSPEAPPWYMIYYIIIAIFVILPLAFGRRAGCHYVCWMAPFMILGRKVRNLLAWPSLRLKAEEDKCNDCQRCTRECPMSLDVNAMVRQEKMENSECVLCGTCVDVCPKDAIRYAFSVGK